MRLVCLVWTLWWCMGGLEAAAPPEPIFDHVSVQHGLSQVTVFDIYQDRQGFLWFGTQDGLNRYDGNSFVVFKNDPNDSRTLSDNYIWVIHEDSKGRMWVGTNGGGLNRIDGLSHQVRRFQNRRGDPLSLSSDRIYAVTEDHDGLIWIGTHGGGVNVYHPDLDRFRVHRAGGKPGDLSDDTVWDLLVDDHGALWVGTSAGLDSYDRRHKNFVHVPLDDVQSTVFKIYRDESDPPGRLWLGTDDGLIRLDEGSATRERIRFDLPGSESAGANWIRAILRDHEGKLWIGTLEGVVLYDPESGDWRRLLHDPANPNGLSNDGIYDFLMDQSGSIWVATAGAGLNKFNATAKKFAAYQTLRQGLLSDIILAVTEDRRGDLWIGSWRGGVSRRDHRTGHFEHFRHRPDDPESLTSNLVRSLYEDSAGRLWVGTDDGVLHRFNEEARTFKRFGVEAAESGAVGPNVIYRMMEDRQQRFWVATGSAGLLQMNGQGEVERRFQHRPGDPTSLGGNRVYTVVQTHDDMLWLGMDGAGVNCIDPNTGRITRFSHEAGNSRTPAGNRSRVIYESSDRTLWIGTDNGLNRRMDDGSFEVFSEADGLPNQVIYGILEDDQRCLWLSTNKGLSKFEPRLRRFRNYDMLDGLPGNEFNTGAYARGRDGHFYFGGVTGLVHFRPDQVVDDTWRPPVVITDISIFGHSVDRMLGSPCYRIEEMALSYQQNFFTFTFTALDFVNPSRNQYAYMMEGLDRDWIMAGNRRFAGYTNLDPGDYVFKVRATNHDGVWNPSVKSLKIRIAPPFWMRSWFRLSLLLAVAGLIFLGHQLRLRAISAKNRQLEDLVNERTAGLAKMNVEFADTNQQLKKTVSLLQREIQDRIRAERELVAAKESAEEATRVKSDFLATMSHEIRTPMNGVIGMTSLLKGTEMTDEQMDYVRTIAASGETLLTLINDILDFSKIEAGKLRLEHEPFRLVDLVEASLMVVAGPALEKGLDLNYAADATLPVYVFGDQARLKQVLVNLLGNAVKFTTSGEIVVRIRRVEAGQNLAPGQCGILISVRDTGIGIPEHKQETIFNAFHQADTSTTRKFGGTGLGLAICRELVHAMGGRIWVKSTPGHGSDFQAQVVLEVAAGEEEPMDRPLHEALMGKHVFAAVANPFLRVFLTETCKRWGLSVTAALGPHWLDELTACQPRPHFFILDEALEQVLSFDALEDAVHDLGPVIRLRSLGATRGGRPSATDMVLIKPPTKRSLFHLVEKALGLDHPVDAASAGLLGEQRLGDLKPLKILVAEDNRVNQKVIKGMLGRLGYVADYAVNGQEAVTAVREHHYDVVLMDVQMPILDGLEATRQIRAAHQNGPVIVGLTANAQPRDRELCLAAGMNAYLSKPVQLDVLADELSRV